MSNTEFEISSNEQHSITSKNVLCCNETGRVIAVFYNEDDLEKAEKLINKDSWIPIEDKSSFENNGKYLIQMDLDNEIHTATLEMPDNDGSFAVYDGLFDVHYFKFYEVKYYQPLPEPKKC